VGTEAPHGTIASEALTPEELRLATRNHGMPLEALRWDITPPGLHYLLVHYDIPRIEAASWRLEVGGEVERTLSLSLEELKGRPRTTLPVTMECAGNGRALLEPRPLSQPWLVEAVGTAEWGGTPLAPLLEEAGVRGHAVEVLFTGLDRGVEGGRRQAYERSLPLAEATRDGVLLAWEMNGEPLPPQHGAPLRLVVPGWYGMTNVKWLGRITVLSEPYEGFQQSVAYRLYDAPDEPGEPVTRMLPRSLMVPPGIPDFMTRERHAEPGEQVIVGRAWSGLAPIERVELSDDGGASWEEAELGERMGDAAWVGWSRSWRASPGDYELCSRATDAAGNSQPVEPAWNLKGYANNAVERVVVKVEPG
jgi:sulfane dehydrogenase subunit SoxC